MAAYDRFVGALESCLLARYLEQMGEETCHYAQFVCSTPFADAGVPQKAEHRDFLARRSRSLVM